LPYDQTLQEQALETVRQFALLRYLTTMQITRDTSMTPSRPCKFCLGLQGGSVFADFDIDLDGRVFLVRISFDGYGCCPTGSNIARLSLSESRIFIESVAANDLDREEIREILSRYFEQNADFMWRDALEEHELINVRLKPP
jgi:hypothetical protein